MPEKSSKPWPKGCGAVGDKIAVLVKNTVKYGVIDEVGYDNEHGYPRVILATIGGKRKYFNVSDITILPQDVPKEAAQFAAKHKLLAALDPHNDDDLRYYFVDKWLCRVDFVFGTVESARFYYRDGVFCSGKPSIEEGFSELRLEGDEDRLTDVPDNFHEYV